MQTHTPSPIATPTLRSTANGLNWEVRRVQRDVERYNMQAYVLFLNFLSKSNFQATCVARRALQVFF